MASEIGLAQDDSLAGGKEVLEFIFLYKRNKLCSLTLKTLVFMSESHIIPIRYTRNPKIEVGLVQHGGVGSGALIHSYHIEKL